MQQCPFCGSEDIYFSKKRKIFVCEDCDKTFLERELSQLEKTAVSNGGLELFFSYGHDKNRSLVERIKCDLEQRGHHVWIDTNEIKAGDNWRDDILNGIMNASRIIAFLSEHSTRNPGVCLDELKIAVCVKGANIKTVLLEPETHIKPPATVSDIQWLDMSEWYDIKAASISDFEQWYKEKFSELCKAIESSESVELNGDIHNLKTKLNPYLNSDKEYNLLSKEFYGRKWLEDYIEEWQNNRSTKTLVLYGRPGTGKSAFSVNYSHYNSDVFGCFLCEWNREYTTNPNRLIRTIAFRLATKLPDYRSLLLRQLDSDVNLDEMNAEMLFDFLLTYPLLNLVDGNRGNGIIVVDGLDEAEINGDNPLASVFSKCVEKLPGWIRFVFTSRPEKSVKKYFQTSETIELSEDMPSGYNDIMAYLIKALAEELHQVSNKLEILNRICEISDGVFLYAEMLVNDIKNGFVKITDVGHFPKGLNAFYRLSMERKFSNHDSFEDVRGIIELMTLSEMIPEELVRNTLRLSQYSLIKYLDKLGSWVNRYKNSNQYWLGFSHKSLKDWFGDREQSGDYYADDKSGALRLARFCREHIEQLCKVDIFDKFLDDYIKSHIGSYYLASQKYDELENFLCTHSDELDPYWRVWNQFPQFWNQTTLLYCFWQSDSRNNFLHRLQREGNVAFLLWIFNLSEKKYGIKEFDNEQIAIYMDVVHMSGDYPASVRIADQYIAGRMDKIETDDFLAMLCVRRIHHSMFYKPTGRLIEEANSLFLKIDEKFPTVYNELLFLIGGNLGLLYGDWDFCKKWLDKSVSFASEQGLDDFNKRNARKLADYYCHICEYDKAEQLIIKCFPDDWKITGRYEAYLTGTLANIYTCTNRDDDALDCYNQLLEYSTAKGIVSWKAHANLGIANVNYKLGNLKESVDFATRAKSIYNSIQQEWGLIMSETILAANESKMGIAPIKVMCEKLLKRAEKMQYGSCVESIKEFYNQKNNYLKLYFL